MDGWMDAWGDAWERSRKTEEFFGGSGNDKSHLRSEAGRDWAVGSDEMERAVAESVEGSTGQGKWTSGCPSLVLSRSGHICFKGSPSECPVPSPS